MDRNNKINALLIFN